MKILPVRTMRLGGKRVEAGKPADVAQKDGELAVKHGWAVVYDKGADNKEADKKGDE